MPLPALAAAGIAAGISALPSLFGGIRGLGQRRQAKRLRAQAVDPGYQMNTAVQQNADILRNRYSNYTMPGYNNQLNQIGSNAATAFNRGVQGASSGSDVIDLATRIAYGTGQQQNNLAAQNAMGREAALGQYLNANAVAGNEQVLKNQYERDRYMQQLAEAAALYNASDQNINNAITGISSIGSSLMMGDMESQRRKKYPDLYGKG